jgi:hypothetical protein
VRTVGHEWRWRDVHALVNTDWHRRALVVFTVLVLAHGLVFPWLVRAEGPQYGFALAMLIGFVLLRPGFRGSAYNWWTIALGIQAWRHYEHLLLVVQAHTGSYLMGLDAPTSVLQLVVPRLALNLFYNVAVFAPMVVAVVVHLCRSSGASPAVRGGVVGEDGLPHGGVDVHADRGDLAGERRCGEIVPGQQRPVR